MTRKRNLTVGERLLLVLARKLDRLPKTRFDYGRWVGAEWTGRQDLSCGTTACALGWACTIPAIRKRGLFLDRARGGAPSIMGTFGLDNPIAAAAFVFGISPGEARGLFLSSVSCEWSEDGFSPRYDATPKAVARHIRAFVAGSLIRQIAANAKKRG